MQDKYRRWVRAAYLYYIDMGADTGMHDLEWDQLGRELFAARDRLPADEYPILHHQDYGGGSLFWVKKSDYPEWAKVGNDG